MEHLWILNVGCVVISFCCFFVCLQAENGIGIVFNIAATALNVMFVALHFAPLAGTR